MATLVRWEPFREIAALQNEMSRFMNGLVEGNGRTTQSWIPTADVWETDGEIVYAFDLPGIPEEKISVELDEGALTISAERTREHELEDGRFHRVERRFGTFAARSACRRASPRRTSPRLRERRPRGARPQAGAAEAAEDRDRVGDAHDKTIEGHAKQK